MTGCLYRVCAFLLITGGAAGAAWLVTRTDITTTGAVGIMAGGAALLVWLFLANERATRRKHQARAESFRQWQAWYQNLPKPDAAKYDNWAGGGAEQWQQDTARYLREQGAEPRIGRGRHG